MGDHNPSDTLFRVSFEDIRGVTPTAGWIDLTIDGEDLSVERTNVERTAMQRSTMRPPALPGKIVADGREVRFDDLNPLADGWWVPLALFNRLETTDLGGGAYEHRFSLLETALVSKPTFSAMIWRADDTPQTFNECLLREWELSFAEKELVAEKVTVVPGKDHYFDDAVRTAGTGTGIPRLRGYFAGTFDPDDAATSNIHLEVLAQTATTVTFRGHVGDATAFAGAGFVATRGRWTDILDEADQLVGTPDARVQVWVGVGDDYDVADTYRIDSRRAEWSPVLSDEIVVNEIYSRLLVDGEEIEIDDGTFRYMRPAAQKHGWGGALPRRTRRRGQSTAELELGREYQDLLFRRKLVLAETVAIDIFMDSGVPIAATNFTYMMKIVSRNGVLAGETSTVEDRETSDESVTLTMHPSSDPTDPEDVVIYLYNDMPTLTGAAAP